MTSLIVSAMANLLEVSCKPVKILERKYRIDKTHLMDAKLYMDKSLINDYTTSNHSVIMLNIVLTKTQCALT